MDRIVSMLRPWNRRLLFLLLLVGIGALVPAVQPASAGCDQALSPGRAYAAYEATAKALKRGKQEPASIEDVACFFPDGTIPDDPDEAYFRLVSEFFHPNVLYDFLAAESDAVLERAKSTGSAVLAWRGGYMAEAAITAYVRTADRRFLDLFVDHFSKVLALRDDRLGRFDVFHRRVMRSWGEYRPGKRWIGPLRVESDFWIAHVTHAARIGLSAAKFAHLVAGDPELADYRPVAEEFATAAAEALTEFNEDCIPVAGIDGCWHIRPMTGGPEATNHVHTLGSALMYLAAFAGGDPDMEERVASIIDVFEKGVVEEADGTVHWKYFPYFADQSGSGSGRQFSEPIWKASQTAPFVYRAFVEGYDVPEALVDAIAETFLTHVLVDDEIMGNISPVDSAPVDSSDDISHLEGIVTWLEYAGREPEIGDRIRQVIAARPDLFPRGWFRSTNSARGYAHFLGSDPEPLNSAIPATNEHRAKTPRQ